MKKRNLMSIFGLTLAGSIATFFLASPALATHTDNKNCSDFSYQEDAQAHMDAHPGDPDGLDRGGIPGKACEALPSKGTSATNDNNSSTRLPVTPGFDREKQILGFGFVLITSGGILLLAVRRREITA